MTDTQAIQLFKCLADRSRLQILKSLALEDMYVERLAQRLDLSPPTVSFHLKKLADAGAVRAYKTQYYTMYTLCREVFAVQLLELVTESSDEADLQSRRDAEYRQKVLDSFFEYGKLKTLPTQLKKQRIVLEEISTRFVPGQVYTEKQVNLILAELHDDFCTLRRGLVSEGLLQRQDSCYLRVDEKNS